MKICNKCIMFIIFFFSAPVIHPYVVPDYEIEKQNKINEVVKITSYENQISALIEAFTNFRGGYFPDKKTVNEVDYTGTRFQVDHIPGASGNTATHQSYRFKISLEATSDANLTAAINSILAMTTGKANGFNKSLSISETFSIGQSNYTDDGYGTLTAAPSGERPTPPGPVTLDGAVLTDVVTTFIYMNQFEKTYGFWKFDISNKFGFLKNSMLTTATFNFTPKTNKNADNTYFYGLESDNIDFSGNPFSFTMTTANVNDSAAWTANVAESVNVKTIIDEIIARANFEWEYLGFTAWNDFDVISNGNIHAADSVIEPTYPPSLVLTFDYPSDYPFYVEMNNVNRNFDSNNYFATIECEARWVIPD